MSWHQTIPGLESSGPRDFSFGDTVAEARLAIERTVAAPLVHLGTLSASGTESETFLQGQLSNDLRMLTAERAQLSSYNSPKGRMLAVLNGYRSADHYLFELHASLAETTLKRLRMYVLRAKTTLKDFTGEMAIFGCAGANGRQFVANAGLATPSEPMDCAWTGDIAVLRRPDSLSGERFTIHIPLANSLELWKRLSTTATPVGTAAWRLLEIEAGLPVVYPETSDRFVAQMCNLDKLGGISFDKGCYTGQEVIARVHYRGAVKRGLSTIDHRDPALAPGTRLEQPAGAEVVDAAPSPDGGARALVVAREADPA